MSASLTATQKRCSRRGCKWFARKQTGSYCGNCLRPFRKCSGDRPKPKLTVVRGGK